MKITKTRSLVCTAIILLVAFTPNSFTQDYDQVQIQTTHVSNEVYMLTGVGGNIGLSVGEDGILLIDSQFPELYEKIISAIAEIDTGKIRFLFNTNWHYDHCSGNSLFAEAGVIIMAHTKTRENMKLEQYNPFFDFTVSAYPEIALPVVTFNDSMTVYFNNDEIKVLHFESAHSDADLVFLFKSANVIHLGDICFVGSYPYIDITNGGTISGVILAVDRILSITNEETKIIPGHGPLTDRGGLIGYRDMLVTVRDRVKKQIDEGKTLEEIIAAKPTAEFDEGKAEWMPSDGFVQLVFDDLSKR
jgi:cyclase